MAREVDISLVGGNALRSMFGKLPPTFERKVLRQTQRKSVRRLQDRIVDNISGLVLEPQTGRYRDALARAPIRALPRSRSLIGVALHMPERNELGITPDDKFYYPFAVEFGSEGDREGRGRLPAFAPIRRAVNDNSRSELDTMTREMKTGIEREAKRLFDRARIR